MLTWVARGVVVAVVAALLTVAASSAAFAGDAFGSVDCHADPTSPGCLVQATTTQTVGTSAVGGARVCHTPAGAVAPCFVDGKGWLADDGCYYQPAAGIDLADAELLGGPAGDGAIWYVGSCGAPATGSWLLTRFRTFGGAAPDPLVLARRAVDRLRLPAPAIRLNPAVPGPQVVRVPTWLWLDGGAWGIRRASASVPGLTVTATATPVGVRWDTGDGVWLTCAGPGTAWSRSVDPRAGSPDCGHTYTAAGTVQVRATITWAVSWRGGGVSGTVAPLASTAAVPVRVVESQTVVTGGSA